MEDTAENLLCSLQQTFAGAVGSEARTAIRDAEKLYGAQATREGRRLHEMVCGSHAWGLFERTRKERGLPRVHGLSQCEPVLQIMRESGELAERERLLHEREAATLALWHRNNLPDAECWWEAETIYEVYAASVRHLTAQYRPFYRALRRAAGAAMPLGGPGVLSRPLLLPPLMTSLFRLCHAGPDGSREHHGSGCTVRAQPPAPLDALTWDIATLIVSAFFARAGWDDAGASFVFLLQDYPEWRRLDSCKRTPALRRQIEERLEFLCSDRLHCESTVALWRTDLKTGRRIKTPVATSGPFLLKLRRFFQRPPLAGRAGQDDADGYWLSLGPWARPLIETRALRGVCLRRLAEYNLQRAQWERQIGWYLTLQMHNQASRMTMVEVTREARTRTVVTPQHPLKMQTVLDGSGIPWQEMARVNPGKVIRQWNDALTTLRRDGIIGPVHCLDGTPDGSDMPTRGRLAAMLTRRYQFIPGKDLMPHVRAKARSKSS